jgi:hypothetical protein
MTLFFSKLGFIHRRLWDRDSFYRVALFFGPAPLIGCGVAAGIWLMVWALPAPIVQPPDWIKLPKDTENWSTSGEPQAVKPASPIPAAGENGGLSGYEAGWSAAIRPIEISPTYNTDIKQTSLNSFFVDDGSKIDLEQIVAAGPKNTRFVGSGSGSLVIRTPGLYALTLHFDRPPGPAADCLMRLVFGSRKIVASFELEISNNFSKTYEAAKFDLQPGLYPTSWALGCWRGQETVGPGTMTILMSQPGDQSLQPVHPDDVVRPVQKK